MCRHTSVEVKGQLGRGESSSLLPPLGTEFWDGIPVIWVGGKQASLSTETFH